jgi:hypothetical protein
MLFSQWANDNVFLLSLILAILFVIGFIAGIKNGGWNRHVVYFWTLLIFLQYVLFSPLFFYNIGTTTIIGTDITGYYGIHFVYNSIAISCFLIGYWVIPTKSDKWEEERPKPNKNLERLITITFYCIYGIVMLNMAAGGINIGNVFFGQEVVGLGAQGASYYLQNFADSLITVLVVGYLYGVKRSKLLTWLGLSFFLFFLLGFRYRIILTLSGLIIAYLYKHKLSVKQISVGALIALGGLYFVVFSTMNRTALIFRNYDALVYDPLQFKPEGFFVQTRGALADMAIFKLYEDPNKVVEHDLGLTMFGYIFIRMIPRFIYPNKDEFYPPPQLAIQGKAYFAWWANKSGEACLSTGSVFIAWGFYGLIFAHFFWGLLLKKFANSVKSKDPLSLIGYIVVALATFQWITRGYFPQAIDHFVYLMIPVWALRYLSKKKSDVSHN